MLVLGFMHFGNGLDVGHVLDLGCVLIECTSPLCLRCFLVGLDFF
jgi:hypothetical protein